jgi:opine dehydrogenase
MSVSVEGIAILGAGPGGLAAAAGLARRGFDVSLYNRSPERIAAIVERGGVEIEGDLGEAFVPLRTVTTSMEEALAGRQLAICFTPANGQRPTAEAAAPFLEPRSVFLLASGSAGSLEVQQVFSEQGLDVVDDILLGETVTLPQSARMVGPVQVRIKFPWKPRTAAFPARNNERLYRALADVMPVQPSPNVLDTGLNNVNFIIHPGPMLLNYAAVERAGGYFSLMNEGMTEGVLRCMDALDAEKMALSRALGLEPISIDDVYYELGSTPDIYRKKGEPFGIRDRIWWRYITEDTPYGTVFFSSLGRLLGVPTPVADALNTLLGVLEKTDFYAEGRTVDKLGLAGRSVSEIRHFLFEGVYPT